jgi:hypothetical protein
MRKVAMSNRRARSGPRVTKPPGPHPRRKPGRREIRPADYVRLALEPLTLADLLARLDLRRIRLDALKERMRRLPAKKADWQELAEEVGQLEKEAEDIKTELARRGAAIPK